MTDARLDLPQGTLDLLILKALSLESMHGWGISERIHQVSRETLQIPQGSLYPALHRLERRGWIKASWGASDNNRRARFYELTGDPRSNDVAESEVLGSDVARKGRVGNRSVAIRPKPRRGLVPETDDPVQKLVEHRDADALEDHLREVSPAFAGTLKEMLHK